MPKDLTRSFSFAGGCSATAVVSCFAWLLIACAGTAPSVNAGRALYASNGCASCHGSSGRGDGPIAKTLAPPPRDLRDLKAFRNGTDTSSIAATLADGLLSDGGRMPRFSHLTREERASLALYVIALRTNTEGQKEQP